MDDKQSSSIKTTNARGGKRQGAGRKPGSRSKKTVALLAAVQEQGITPLEFMLNIMRSEPPQEATASEFLAHQDRQFEAAKAAAPYVHAKLANIEMNANVTNHEAKIEDLE